MAWNIQLGCSETWRIYGHAWTAPFVDIRATTNSKLQQDFDRENLGENQERWFRFWEACRDQENRQWNSRKIMKEKDPGGGCLTRKNKKKKLYGPRLHHWGDEIWLSPKWNNINTKRVGILGRLYLMYIIIFIYFYINTYIKNYIFYCKSLLQIGWVYQVHWIN